MAMQPPNVPTAWKAVIQCSTPLPTGDHKGGENFPDTTKFSGLYLPFGMTVEVFNQGDFQGAVR